MLSCCCSASFRSFAEGLSVSLARSVAADFEETLVYASVEEAFLARQTCRDVGESEREIGRGTHVSRCTYRVAHAYQKIVVRQACSMK